MSIDFKEETRRSTFLDPFSRFEERERTVAIREDPLTGAVARVFNYRRRPPQSSEPTRGDPVCAFCAENVDTLTPRFLPPFCAEGRIRRGEAVVFPNLFPYDTHNAVVVMSRRHEVGIGEWSPRLLTDALLACRDYISRVVELEGGEWFPSVNWNYTPIAGASQIHPHLQILVSRRPTRELGRLVEASRAYTESHGSNYWQDLVRAEESTGERYVGRTGKVPWVVSFAPRGFVPDVTAVLDGHGDFTGCSDDEVEDLARGLVSALCYYESRWVRGANLTLYGLTPGRPHFATHARLVPRLRIPPLNISDVNYFKLMHDEGLCLVTPEVVCEEIKKFFPQGG